jgi:hypothetical protein
MRRDEEEEDRKREEERSLKRASNRLSLSSNELGIESIGVHSQSFPVTNSVDAIIRSREKISSNPMLFSTSYPPISNNRNSNSMPQGMFPQSSPQDININNNSELDLEELMLMEAIRLSLKSSSFNSNNNNTNSNSGIIEFIYFIN